MNEPMKPGDQTTIEWDVDGMLWEVDIEMTNEKKVKNGVKRVKFVRVDDPTKTYNFTKKQLNKLIATPWELMEDDEEF